MNVISPSGLEEYVRRYLLEYRNLFESYESSLGDLSDFEFYSGYPYHAKGIISEVHGTAIFFYPSSEEKIEIQPIEERIEFYLWPVMKDNPPTTFWETENNGNNGITSYYIRANLQIGNGTVKTFFHHQRNEIAIFADSEILFDYRVIVKPLGYFKVDGVLIYENRMILKGSNDKEDWLPEVALLDATDEFLRLARNIALNEAEIRQIEGFSLLKAKLEQIERNLASGAYEDNWRLRWKDEQEFWQIVEEYDLLGEFARRIIDETLRPYLEPEPEPEPNPILEAAKIIIIPIIVAVVAGLIVARVTGKWNGKKETKEEKTRKTRRESKKTKKGRAKSKQ